MRPGTERGEVRELLRRILRERPRAALILAELLGPPPALREEAPRAAAPEEQGSPLDAP